MSGFRFAFTGLLFSMLLSSLASAEIYKTVDKNGHTIYTDLPPANSQAKPVDLGPTNIIPKVQSNGAPATETQPRHQYPQYQIQIFQPSAGTQLTPEQRNLAVAISASSPLEQDLFFSYLIDGNVALESTNTSVSLPEPPRGEHQLTVEVRSKDGEQFGKSEPIPFSVLRPILKQKSEIVPAKK